MYKKHRQCKASTSKYVFHRRKQTFSFETDGESEYNPKVNEYSLDSDDNADTIDLDCFDKEICTERAKENVDTNGMKKTIKKRTRKRLRNQEQWKREINKRSRTSGEQYNTEKGKLVKKRELKQLFNHSCRYKCSIISEEQRKTIFENFYKLPSYDLQTNFIASCIKKTQPTRMKRTANFNKKYATCIELMNFRVCKAFFLATLDISNRRFTTVCSKISNEGFVELDQRGRHTPSNKIAGEVKNKVIEHIKMFPRYRSHYSRSQNDSTKYLSEDLNIRKMYNLYCEFCSEKKLQPVKETYYRYIFCTEFNLKFHKPHSDTCNTCDRLNNVLKNSKNMNEICIANRELELHHRKVKSVETSKKLDIEFCSQNSETTRLVCFDLQKVLATPLLTTNKVYYLRQLSTYNFCVHDIISGKSYMYIWNETQASRGSQEIGSCLIKFIKDLPNKVEHLICYSDSCGGQNKNKNLAKLFMYIVQATSINTIEHKFYEPGHSYMECDRSFGIIEKRKKKIPQVFVPTHWTSVIQKSSKNFVVYEMKNSDFVSFRFLHLQMSDPKKDNEKNVLKWRNIVWFKYRKELLFQFLFKNTRNQDFPFQKSITCSKLNPGKPHFSVNSLVSEALHSSAVNITYMKYKNLMDLLIYIPPIHHDFYKNIAHESSKKKNTQISIISEDEEEANESTKIILESDYE